jgi:cell division septum initiation protein DivIVA
MPDVQGKLDEIITMVETAKGKALSGSAAVIDRAALLGALEELRQLLPAEMSEARSLLRERDDLQADSRAQADVLLGKAHAEADRLAAAARAARDRMLTESALIAEAQRVAAEITQDAEAEAQRMREQTDDYVDASLARFEQLLAGSLETVTRGRARVAASREEAQLGASAEQSLAVDEASAAEPGFVAAEAEFESGAEPVEPESQSASPDFEAEEAERAVPAK